MNSEARKDKSIPKGWKKVKEIDGYVKSGTNKHKHTIPNHTHSFIPTYILKYKVSKINPMHDEYICGGKLRLTQDEFDRFEQMQWRVK